MTDTSSLTGRTAIVTGSTSGIGEATARLLAARGAHVVVSGRDRTKGEAVAGGITAGGGRADFVAVDLAGPHQAVRTFAATAAEALGGHVDIVVNNAGTYPAPATADLDDADLDTMLAVNVRAPHVLVAALAPGMVSRGSGAIVNVGSWMARVGVGFAGMYSATKAALEQLTRTWASEYGLSGVRVTTCSPGATHTPGNHDALSVLDAMTGRTPGRRPVSTDEVARAIAFLVSDEATMVHGTILSVDGGIDATRTF